VGALLLLLSCSSAYLAYSGADYPIAGQDVAEVAQGREGVEVALRGIRGTSAALGAGFAVLMIGLAAGPYRDGSRWSWWTLLLANLTVVLVTAARVSTIGTRAGVGTALVPGALVLLALILDAGRLRSSAS
jgi:hypothetical protein